MGNNFKDRREAIEQVKGFSKEDSLTVKLYTKNEVFVYENGSAVFYSRYVPGVNASLLDDSFETKHVFSTKF